MRIFIIGGGAAGMLAAIFAAKNYDAEVTVLERNDKLGKKLFITGKGRCNITNLADYEEYFNNIISNPKFMRGALKLMPPDSLLRLLNENGLPTKVERGNRVFPFSDKSSDVIKALTNCLHNSGVKVLFNQKVTDFVIENNRITSIVTENEQFFADKVILATGGKSYSSTGSDGLGYHLARKAGHTIVPLKPALVPIITDKCYNAKNNTVIMKDLPSLQGLSLKNIEARIVNGNQKCLFKEFGELLFTDKGLSGPVILTLSSKINRMDFNELKLTLDLKPALDIKTLDNRLLREFSEKKNKFFKNSLNDLLPSKMIPFIIKLSDIHEDLPVNAITKAQRQSLCNLLKGLSFDIKSLDDINCGVVTAGGVDTKEINPKTMQSKLIDNLYFAGEIIDIDALTGGYNLQLAFSTGCAAGTYITQ